MTQFVGGPLDGLYSPRKADRVAIRLKTQWSGETANTALYERINGTQGDWQYIETLTEFDSKPGFLILEATPQRWLDTQCENGQIGPSWSVWTVSE